MQRWQFDMILGAIGMAIAMLMNIKSHVIGDVFGMVWWFGAGTSLASALLFVMGVPKWIRS